MLRDNNEYLCIYFKTIKTDENVYSKTFNGYPVFNDILKDMESKDVSKILEKSYQLSDFSNEPRTEFEYKNFRCEYVQHGTQRKWWCGYIEIPRKFFQNKDENSIIESLNWFGGTTYKEEEGKNIKIGFHTNHLDGELFTKFQVIQDIQKTVEQILSL